jgi:hypothetical protein
VSFHYKGVVHIMLRDLLTQIMSYKKWLLVLNEASEHINRVVVSGHFIHFSNVFECKEILKKSYGYFRQTQVCSFRTTTEHRVA